MSPTPKQVVNFFDHKNLIREIKLVLPSLEEQRIEILTKNYLKDWKIYHNESLVCSMLQIFKSMSMEHPYLDLESMEIRKLKVMIIYLYSVYELGKEPGWNRMKSSLLCRNDLVTCNMRNGFIQDVCSGILASDRHSLEGIPKDLQHIVCYLLDIELFANFGDNEETFTVNSTKNAAECSLFTTPEVVKLQCRELAKLLLKRESIYFTDYFKQYEPHARKMLTQFVES